jgi:hypothetical protein
VAPFLSYGLFADANAAEGTAYPAGGRPNLRLLGNRLVLACELSSTPTFDDTPEPFAPLSRTQQSLEQESERWIWDLKARKSS